MSWMSPNMLMETTTNGGIGKVLGRAFSGDTLFEGSYGRIDFPTGSGRQMIHSVADILLNLPDDTNVYPGHMGYTTIADEKQYNPLAGYRGREA